MKTLFALIFNFIVFSIQSQIEALFDLKKFHSNEKNYIETYLYVYGNTLNESSDSNNKEKGVKILQFIEDENNKIIAHKKYVI
jgi:hypothetical protein